MPWVMWLPHGRVWGRRREGNPRGFVFHLHCDFLLDIRLLKAKSPDLLEDSPKSHAFSSFSLVKPDIQTRQTALKAIYP